MYKKSRLVSFVDRGPPSWSQLCRTDKEHTSDAKFKGTDALAMNWTSSHSVSTSSDFAQLVLNAANELASSGQHGEVNTFLRFVKEQFPTLGNVQLPNTSYDEKEKTPYSFETLEQDMYLSICGEVQDDGKISTAGGDSIIVRDAGSVLLGKYIAEIAREMSKNSSAPENVHSENAPVESTSQHTAYDSFGPSDCDGLHLSSCGHGVHQECLDRYLSSLKER